MQVHASFQCAQWGDSNSLPKDESVISYELCADGAYNCQPTAILEKIERTKLSGLFYCMRS